MPLLIFNHGFRFQDFVCNGCHDLAISCLRLSNIGIIAIKGVEYRCIIHKISKSEAFHLLENSELNDSEYI